MATRLLKAATDFLPFNRGSHPGEVQCGAGNPQHPSGYRTGYFPSAHLFNALPEGEQQAFCDRLGGYVQMYAFLSQIIPYADSELDMRYSYGRFLLPHLQLEAARPMSAPDAPRMSRRLYRRSFSCSSRSKKGHAETCRSCRRPSLTASTNSSSAFGS